jgi:hypothetical protein
MKLSIFITLKNVRSYNLLLCKFNQYLMMLIGKFKVILNPSNKIMMKLISKSTEYSLYKKLGQEKYFGKIIYKGISIFLDTFPSQT